MKKKTNKYNSSTFTIIVLGGFLVIMLITVFLNMISSYSSQSQITNNSNETKIYDSKNLKFSIEIPISYSIKEGQTYVDIIINDMMLEVVRNGTNFESLEEYVKDFDSKKKITVMDEKSLIINGYQFIRRIETNTATIQKQKIYYIYSDNWVYSISTGSEALFDDLDKIAQSFKYTP